MTERSVLGVRWVWPIAGTSMLALAAYAAMRMIDRAPQTRPPVELRANGPLTIALTGDSLLPPDGAGLRDERSPEVVEWIRRADLAVTNLDESLLGGDELRQARADDRARWPFGTGRTAAALADAGFDVVSVANNHAIDFGPEGLLDTIGILRSAGLLPVGAGRDLSEARGPALVGGAARRIAVLAVASSASPESRATPARDVIRGRPGISPLRYIATITADPTTFGAIRQALPAIQAPEPSDDERHLTFLGTSVALGERTSISLALDDRDGSEICDAIVRARQQAEAVIVSVHSHEPANDSDTPAPFLQAFAHQAIDAGAALVVAHGPHRVRGIEIYKGAAILYSVGNFVYRAPDLDVRAADAYDAGYDLYHLALGAIDQREAARRTPFDQPEWWQSVVAFAAIDGGRVSTIRLEPIDLGADVAAKDRGTPRPAAGARATAILERVDALSRPYGTHLRVEGHAGVIALP